MPRAIEFSSHPVVLGPSPFRKRQSLEKRMDSRWTNGKTFSGCLTSDVVVLLKGIFMTQYAGCCRTSRGGDREGAPRSCWRFAQRGPDAVRRNLITVSAVFPETYAPGVVTEHGRRSLRQLQF